MSWQLRNECERREVESLAAELEVSEVLASVLARRGLDDPRQARAFLEAELPAHDPLALGDMREACDAIEAAVAAGTRICVHGDYDADGICATALAVLILRELGADGLIQEPRSSLGRYLVRHWEQLSLIRGESLVYWLRKLVFRGAWLDHRVKEGLLEVDWDDDEGEFAYRDPRGDRALLELAPVPSWHDVQFRR